MNLNDRSEACVKLKVDSEEVKEAICLGLKITICQAQCTAHQDGACQP